MYREEVLVRTFNSTRSVNSPSRCSIAHCANSHSVISFQFQCSFHNKDWYTKHKILSALLCNCKKRGFLDSCVWTRTIRTVQKATGNMRWRTWSKEGSLIKRNKKEEKKEKRQRSTPADRSWSRVGYRELVSPTADAFGPWIRIGIFRVLKRPHPAHRAVPAWLPASVLRLKDPTTVVVKTRTEPRLSEWRARSKGQRRSSSSWRRHKPKAVTVGGKSRSDVR